MKKRIKAAIPEVCIAVKRVRQTFADSQERFAQRLQIAVMTLSRFELGKKVPRDPQILRRLRSLANEKSLTEEAALFETAFEQSAQRHKSAVFKFSVPELASSMALDVINEDLIRPGDTVSPSDKARLRRLMGEFWYALKQEQEAGWPGAPQRMSTAAQALDSIRQIRIEALRRVTRNAAAEDDFNLLNYLEQRLQADPPPSVEEMLGILQAAKQDRIRKHVAETTELRKASTNQQAENESSGLARAGRKEAVATGALVAEEAAPQQSKGSPKVKEKGTK